MKNAKWWFAFAVLGFFSLAAEAQRQDLGPANSGLSLTSYPYAQPLRSFLNRQTWPGYWNYGKYPYTRNTLSVRSFEVYDRLGSHLFRGLPLFAWRETRSDSVGLQESALDRERFFFTFFNNIVVANDSYSGWNFGLTVGDAIRTTLTPLTLRTPRWQGLRIDGVAENQGLTVLLTRGSLARFSAFDARRDLSPVLAYGGHYYINPNKVTTLGMTLFNQHQVDVEARDGSFVSGTQPYQMQMPEQIFVRLESDAPQSGSAAAVYGVEIEVEVVDPADGSTRRLSSNSQAVAPIEYEPALEPRVQGGRLESGRRVVQGAGEGIDYIFSLPPGLQMVRAIFRADVAGDYRLSVRQAHDFFNVSDSGTEVEARTWPSVANPSHSQLGNRLYPFDFKPTEDVPHFTVARAEGRPSLERRRTVRFNHGIPSGKTLLGTDFKISAQELMAAGEVVYNIEESHFPFSSDSLGVRGRKSAKGSWAYLFNVSKPFSLQGRQWKWAGELFRMDPDYSGGYDSRRGGTVFFTDKGLSGGREAVTQEFPLMEDNDDNDEYPDDTFPDQGRFQQFVPGSYSGGRSGGVFPGLDADGDLTPDNDKDRNGVPDWIEPFLLFSSDPAEFVYGIDFNNNGQPDFRENDDHADYPIRKDQKGLHSYVGLDELVPGFKRLAVGYYNIEEIAGWGQAKSLYGRMEAGWRPLAGVEIELDDDIKLVEDTIRDDVYEWVIGDTSRLANVYSILVPPPPDPLVMQKSLVNTAFLRLTYQPSTSLRLQTDLLHFLNRQRQIEAAGIALQEADAFAELSLISRAEYNYVWRKVDIWTGVKYALKEGRRGPAWNDASLRFFTPIVKAAFEIMPGMTLQWGTSGLPGLPMRLVDDQNEILSYDERKMVFMLSGRTDDFQGSAVGMNTGLELHRRDYDEGGPERDFDTFGLFVEIIVGN